MYSRVQKNVGLYLLMNFRKKIQKRGLCLFQGLLLYVPSTYLLYVSLGKKSLTCTVQTQNMYIELFYNILSDSHKSEKKNECILACQKKML